MKVNWKELLTCIAIPVLTGLLAGFLTRNGVEIFATVQKPPLSPPAWLFPVVWTILYVLMGIASYLVLQQGPDRVEVEMAFRTYFWQLFFNFVWPILFFNFQNYLVSLIWLIIMWILILITIFRFYKCNRLAAYIMIPYLLWTTFAGYLNFGIFWLNSL